MVQGSHRPTFSKIGRYPAHLPPITGIQSDGSEVDQISNKGTLGHILVHMVPQQSHPPHTLWDGQDGYTGKYQQPGYISSKNSNIQDTFPLSISLQHKLTIPTIATRTPIAIMSHGSL